MWSNDRIRVGSCQDARQDFDGAARQRVAAEEKWRGALLRSQSPSIHDTLYHSRLASIRPISGMHDMAAPLTDRLAAQLAKADAVAAKHGLALTPLRRQVYALVAASER